MKKTLIAVTLMSLLLTGCANSDKQSSIASDEVSTSAPETGDPVESTPEESDPVKIDPEESTPEESTPEESIPEEKKLFVAGLWSATLNDIPIGYYTMYPEGGGATTEFDMGIGVAFEYEIGENEVTFFYGAPDAPTHYTVQGGDLSAVDLLSETGDTLILRHISDDTEISFNTNEDLAKFASGYYCTVHGEIPPCATAVTNPDGTVTIQLYEDMTDHRATWAWYTVDRNTGEGTDDIEGDAIDIIP